MRFLRLVGAGLFVYAAFMMAAVLFARIFEGPFFVVAVGAVLAIGAGTVLAAIRLFGGRAPLSGESHEALIQKLEAGDLLDTQNFTARRAFQVEELEDEGSHYFVELTDGSVLYLDGQYLYDYEPIDGDPGLRQPRRFPCTAFTVRRHRHERYVVDLSCEGDVLEPEVTASPFTHADSEAGHIPEDGQIIRDVPYDRLKAHRLATSA